MPEFRAWRVADRDDWNAFVESAAYRSFPQLWEWGELREPTGWRPLRLAVGQDPAQPPPAAAQVLLRRRSAGQVAPGLCPARTGGRPG